MTKSLLEIENENTTIYDYINEYCTVEHVNEGYFRVSMKKRRINHRPALIKILLGIWCIGIKDNGYEKIENQ
jgi:hypothetical protein